MRDVLTGAGSSSRSWQRRVLWSREGCGCALGSVAGRGSNGIHYTPVNSGPLKRNIAETFAGGSYTKIVLKDDAVFYRV